MTTNITAAASFTPDTMTVEGHVFECTYEVDELQTVNVLLSAEVNGQQARPLIIPIKPSDPRHAAALAAAQSKSPAKQAKAVSSQPSFRGKIVAFTGTLSCVRSEAIELVKHCGGQAFDGMCASTNLLVIGDDPGGQKLEKARRWGVETIDAAEFFARCNQVAQAEAMPVETEAPAQVEAPARCLGFEDLPHRPRKSNAEAAPVETEAPAPEVQPEPIQAEAAPIPVETEAPAPAGRDPKQARGPVPEKDFIGQVIKGQGWKIVFDGSEERTRVIFLAPPPQAAEKATQEAGFFWSPLMKSWNKKLSFKAYRAAQGLALQLKAICG